METCDRIWDEIHNSKAWGKYPAEHVIRFVARNYYNVSDRSKVKILDFGCGAGANTWFLAREGFNVFAFDGAKMAVEKARMLLYADGLNADIKQCDALSIDYNTDSFDLVIDNACIYANTFGNIKKMYKKIYEILKKDGKLLTSVFTTKTTGFDDDNSKKIEEHTYTNITYGPLLGRGVAHFFNEGEIYEILENVGFEDICVETLEFTDRGSVISMFIVSGRK